MSYFPFPLIQPTQSPNCRNGKLGLCWSLLIRKVTHTSSYSWTVCPHSPTLLSDKTLHSRSSSPVNHRICSLYNCRNLTTPNLHRTPVPLSALDFKPKTTFLIASKISRVDLITLYYRDGRVIWTFFWEGLKVSVTFFGTEIWDRGKCFRYNTNNGRLFLTENCSLEKIRTRIKQGVAAPSRFKGS